jgi:hypothetical protein
MKHLKVVCIVCGKEKKGKPNLRCRSCITSELNNKPERKLKFMKTINTNINCINSRFSTEKNSGSNNKMFGRSIYDVWLEKYGKEIADEKLLNFKKMRSEKMSGKNNHMYGKPTPKKSGNGWTGWYKNKFYFRSLRELSYVVKLDKLNLEWQSAEQGVFRIKYKNSEERERTYCPDFVVENKYIVEIKPKALHTSRLVQEKCRIGEKWCEQHNYVFKLKDQKILNFEQLVFLQERGVVEFSDRTKLKFAKFCKDKL